MIKTERGDVAIENIKAGDWVIATDFKNLTYKRAVADADVVGIHQVWELLDSEGNAVRASEEQLFAVTANIWFNVVQMLETEDVMMSRMVGRTELFGMLDVGPDVTYAFQLEGYTGYYADGFLVHH